MNNRVSGGVRENLNFLISEVTSQATNLRQFFKTPAREIGKRILDRSGYAYNLKIRIHESCLNQPLQGKDNGQNTLSRRAIESIATDLERISELCRDCINHLSDIDDMKCLNQKNFISQLDLVISGIELIDSVIQSNETDQALKLGRIEQKLDQAYDKLRKYYTSELKQKKYIEDLVSLLFCAQSVEQMGDALLRISEAIISINLGQPINFERYQSLKASVEQLESDAGISNLVIEPIAETRSGSRISGINTAESNNGGYVAIYKDGLKRKLKEEREGVESWHAIFPGLAPKILDYKKHGQSASLLIEHLSGMTFEQILLHESRSLLQKTLKQLTRTLESVWNRTYKKKPATANYMRQLEKRLGEVYRIHPEFKQSDCRINSHSIASFDSLLQRALKLETKVRAPFSVFIHGDFNLDNIIYDPAEKKINFIDLHRSEYTDYVQDISVFMVSNYRLQVLDPPLRRRIMEVAFEFYRFAAAYADKRRDEEFQLRLALGLARSFMSSTRFILDKSLARAMFLRSQYLIENVLLSRSKKSHNYQIPIKEIFFD